MPHIHTGPGEIDETASGFILHLDGEEPAVLLHNHKKLHSLMQLGGHREVTDTPWQTVLKEIVEESGFTADQLSVMQPQQRLKHLTGTVLHPLPFCENTHAFPGLDHRHSDHVYALAADSRTSRMSPGDGESRDFVWVTDAELQALPPAQIKQDIREMAHYALTVIAAHWQQIPVSEFET